MSKYTLLRDHFMRLVNTGALDQPTFIWSIAVRADYLGDMVFTRWDLKTGEVTYWKFLIADWGHNDTCELTQVDQVMQVTWQVRS